jgi:hypothetical protein
VGSKTYCLEGAAISWLGRDRPDSPTNSRAYRVPGGVLGTLLPPARTRVTLLGGPDSTLLARGLNA